MPWGIKANKGAFDSVWFSMGISYPPLAWHREQARRCAGAAADLRNAGLSASIEVQTTIGHGDALLCASDCTGRTWSTWTGWGGAVAKESGCPSDPLMQDYFVEVVRLHAAWKPDMIWIDDDFRLNNRAPSANPWGEPGCCCARCVKLFCDREGAQLTRAEIVSRCRTDAAFRARWVASQVATLCGFARKLAAAVREVSPETRMGLQFAAGGFMPEIAKALAEASGNPVVLRPGAGAYWDTNPYEQIEKAYLLGGAKAGYDGCGWIAGWCPEIETCPRTFSCRTAQGILLEAFENLATGMDFLSLFVVDSTQQESVAWYHNHLFRRVRGWCGALRTGRRGFSRPCGQTPETRA